MELLISILLLISIFGLGSSKEAEARGRLDKLVESFWWVAPRWLLPEAPALQLLSLFGWTRSPPPSLPLSTQPSPASSNPWTPPWLSTWIWCPWYTNCLFQTRALDSPWSTTNKSEKAKTGI